MHKVGRAVYRVDDPRRRVRDLSSGARCEALLADKLVRRVSLGNGILDYLFNALIGFGDKLSDVFRSVRALRRERLRSSGRTSTLFFLDPSA